MSANTLSDQPTRNHNLPSLFFLNVFLPRVKKLNIFFPLIIENFSTSFYWFEHFHQYSLENHSIAHLTFGVSDCGQTVVMSCWVKRLRSHMFTRDIHLLISICFCWSYTGQFYLSSLHRNVQCKPNDIGRQTASNIPCDFAIDQFSNRTQK